MANWIDLISLFLTISVAGGIIYGIMFVMQQVSTGVQSTKNALKEKGLHISDKGVSVKTSKRFDREDYVDATQRGFVKAMGAASFGSTSPGASSNQTPLLAPIQRSSSSSSSSDKKKKPGFSIRKSFSKEGK